ncbi:MAG: hypothetical protein FJY88_09160 [Candidatus Eisenbacteria bacterium]|nr:hypothetical protein [Candidatus Eisenbacteria bacterium]
MNDRRSESLQDPRREGAPLWNPYVAGVALGLVLLASFVVMGQGLGASGGIARILVTLLAPLMPEAIASNANFRNLLAEGNPLLHFLVFLGLGVLLGGYVGAMTGGRIRIQLERGPRMGRRGRIAYALIGGLVMGFAARLALGCTSGQALSGGATLAAGSWVFMMCVFAGGYAVAWFVRRQWI